MNTYFASRLLVPVLAVVLVVTGLVAGPASRAGAIDNHAWSETESQEDVLVQACDGYDLTTSYNMNRNHHLFTDYTDGLKLEQETVNFTGAIGNSLTGKSYAYDGKFTRWSDYLKNEVTVNDLELRFEVGTPGEFTVAVDRIERDVVADPAEVIKQFVPYALRLDLCYLLGAPVTDPAPVEPIDPINQYTLPHEINADTCADRSRPGVPLPC
jgi:hypothetical protein